MRTATRIRVSIHTSFLYWCRFLGVCDGRCACVCLQSLRRIIRTLRAKNVAVVLIGDYPSPLQAMAGSPQKVEVGDHPMIGARTRDQANDMQALARKYRLPHVSIFHEEGENNELALRTLIRSALYGSPLAAAYSFVSWIQVGPVCMRSCGSVLRWICEFCEWMDVCMFLRSMYVFMCMFYVQIRTRKPACMYACNTCA